MSSDFSEDYLPLLGLLNLLNWQRCSYLRGVLSTIRGFVRAPWCSCALVWPDLRGPSIETGSAWNASSLASHPRLLGQLLQETKLHFEHAFQIEFVLKLDFWNPLFVFLYLSLYSRNLKLSSLGAFLENLGRNWLGEFGLVSWASECHFWALTLLPWVWVACLENWESWALCHDVPCRWVVVEW